MCMLSGDVCVESVCIVVVCCFVCVWVCVSERCDEGWCGARVESTTSSRSVICAWTCYCCLV